MRRDLCLCDEVRQVRTRTRIVLLRHALESFRSTNTGRIALLALSNATLATHGAEGGDERVDPGEKSWLLFPDGARRPEGEPPRTIVVVDASWSQARRMVQRIEWVRRMPRLSIESGPVLPRLRTAPRADGLGTFEAIIRALGPYEDRAVIESLERLCRLHAERSRMAKGARPTRML